MSEYHQRMDEYVELIDERREDILFDLICNDWDAELELMAKDETYYVESLTRDDLREFGLRNKVLDYVNAWINENEDKELTKHYNEVLDYETKLLNQMKSIFRDHILKRPDYEKNWTMLVCKDCNHFSKSVRDGLRHSCHKNEQGKYVITYDSTTNKPKQKVWKHTCKECNYSTNSDMSIATHNRSREHLAKKNEPKKVEYVCEICDKKYRFNAEYERHLSSVKHRKVTKT